MDSSSQAQTPIQVELSQTLLQGLQPNEQVQWYAFPDRTHRAKRPPARSLFSSWILLRILLLGGMLVVLFSTSRIYHTNAILPVSYAALFLLALIVGVGLFLLRREMRLRHLHRTIYAITNWRLIVITLDRGQLVQNSFYATDLGRIDLAQRTDGWGDIVIGQQRIQSNGLSLVVVTPRLSGVAKVKDVASLLLQLKSGQRAPA